MSTTEKERTDRIDYIVYYVTAGELMKVSLFAYPCIKAIFLKSYLAKPYAIKNLYNSALLFVFVMTVV